MKKKILLYGDLNLNIVDGSSVWLASLAKLLSNDPNNIVDILLKQKINNQVLVGELLTRKNVTFLTSEEYISKEKTVELDNIVKVMKKIDELRDYSCIIVRGFEAVKTITTNKNLCNKLIPYLTDFCHDKEKITEKEISELVNIYNSTNQFFVQTIQMQKYLEEVLKVDGEKFKLLNPMIFKEDLDNVPKKKKSIVYAGKLALGWNIVELIEIMEKLYEQDKEITLHMIGDKFNRDLVERKEEILNKLQTMPNIVFYGSLPKDETTKIVNSCELGYSFRSTDIDNDSSLELSSKVLEYCFCNVPLLLRKTKMHDEILGEDYPLYVESVDECVTKILNYFNKKEEFSNLKTNIEEKVSKFAPSKIYENVSKALEHFPSKKLRLLITGHDLKFIKPLFPLFEKEFELTVQEYPEYTNLNKKEAKKLIKKQDIIWCEWLLTNARWYSNNLYSFQKLFIRAHRFELKRKYGHGVNWNNVTKLITVSYYYMENFIEEFNIPRNKITVINNFIDVNSYSTKKEKDYKYNIAMIGILPKRKGFSKAIDVLINLKKNNPKYKLYIAGKRPEEFPGTSNAKEEREYYQEVYEKIKEHDLEDSVIFTGWIKISDFLEKIGYTLSLSDSPFPESFHISPFECIASKGVGLSLDWEGIEYIYPNDVVFNSIEEISNKIIECNKNHDEYQRLSEIGRNFIIDNYDLPIIWKSILDTVKGGNDNDK